MLVLLLSWMIIWVGGSQSEHCSSDPQAINILETYLNISLDSLGYHYKNNVPFESEYDDLFETQDELEFRRLYRQRFNKTNTWHWQDMDLHHRLIEFATETNMFGGYEFATIVENHTFSEDSLSGFSDSMQPQLLLLKKVTAKSMRINATVKSMIFHCARQAEDGIHLIIDFVFDEYSINGTESHDLEEIDLVRRRLLLQFQKYHTVMNGIFEKLGNTHKKWYYFTFSQLIAMGVLVLSFGVVFAVIFAVLQLRRRRTSHIDQRVTAYIDQDATHVENGPPARETIQLLKKRDNHVQ